MILAHIELENYIKVEPGIVNVFVIEDEKKFYEYCSELFGQSEGQSGRFIMSDGNRQLSFLKDVRVITDIFSLSFSDKKAQNALLNSLYKIAEEDLLAEYTELSEKVFSLLEKLKGKSDFAIEYDSEQCLPALLKAFGVRWQSEYPDLLSELIAYFQLNAAMLNVRCFIVFNLKCFLSSRELEELYKHMALEDISLILIENTCREKLFGEIVTVIDKDLCEFVV